MAKDKSSFILYADQRSYFDKLTDDEAGRLIKHIFSYVNDENPEPVDRIIDLSFEPIKLQLKRDLKKYEKVVDRNRNNGKLGGRPKKQNEPKKPTGLIENPTKPKKADNDNDNDTDNVINNISIDFDKLINLYNDKFGRTTRTLPKKAKKQIIDRLKEGYTKNDFVTALENAKNDQYHKDNNYKYITLEFISRPDKFERYSSNHNFKVQTKIL